MGDLRDRVDREQKVEKKKIKDTVIGILVVVVIGATVLWVYNNERNKVSRDLAKRIAELSPRGGPPETIEGLQQAIKLYEDQIERNIREAAQTGVYWKILAIRLADKGMHLNALDAFEKALQYNSNDPTLFFLIGESASVAAASSLGFSADSADEKEHFTKLAESAYLQSIQMDPVYAKPRLGLGILYTRDFSRAADAIPHLERYMEILPNSIQGMMALGRAYYMTQNYNRAIEMYDRIISRTKDANIRAQAENNIAMIRDLM